MFTTNLKPSSVSAASILLVVLAFAIQIQLTLFKTPEYIGLRINAADLIVPFAGLWIFVSLLLKRTKWPAFNLKGVYLWLFALGAVLIAALGHSYLKFEELSSWGLQNKVIGWFVLSSFLLMGAWISTNTPERNILRLLKITSIFLLCIVSVQIVFDILFFHFRIEVISSPLAQFPIEALMANKNSFIFFYLTLACFLSMTAKSDKLTSNLNILFWTYLPLVYFFTGARSALITLPFIFIFLYLFRQNLEWKKIVSGVIIGVLLCVVLANTNQRKIYSLKSINVESLTHVDKVIEGKDLGTVANEVRYIGDSNRLNMLHHVFGMIKENPILGSGLGSVLITQEREHGKFIDLMDCTILWLWAETGIFGLALFLAFYFLCFRALLVTLKNEQASQLARDLSKGAILMLVIFGVMSLFHELLYSRFLWLFLGMMLALPRIEKLRE